LLGDDAAGVGYLLKQRVTEPASFTEAVRRVARGGSALDPEVVAHILERRRPGGPIDSLTEREREVLARMAEGQSNRRIASELDLSDATMERVQGRIFEKLELPVDVEGHRRVLAVLTYLRALQD
jgi:DNA-binding NarL/FixJ family response regulator